MTPLLENAARHLDVLCSQIATRQMGSSGNQQATAYAAEVLRSNGYQVETPAFQCIDWVGEKATLSVEGQDFKVQPSPYSLPCKVKARLHTAGTLDELQRADCEGEILLLHGDLAREQIMPKNYPFYNPELHQLILSLVESKSAAALITATGRNPELAGAVYPFPLFEDGNFDVPSVYTTEEVGLQLTALAGSEADLFSNARRIPSTGCNVIGRVNAGAMSKITVCAHIDAKIGTPGALDNAAGVVTLLLAAELLKAYAGYSEIEMLVMNGEDNYGAHGELLYLEQNEGTLGRITSFINMDGLGLRSTKTAFSFYNQIPEKLSVLQNILRKFPGVIEGEPWYQGDHMVLVMKGVPAIAVTTEKFMELEVNYAHTSKDVPALVDLETLVEAAQAVRMIVEGLGE